MSEPVIEYGEWETVDLCKTCGVIVNDRYQIYRNGSPCCSNCGAVSKYVLSTFTTTRRYCYTYKPSWYEFWKKVEGYWEWSGKSLSSTGGLSIPSHLMVGRTLSNFTPTIAAAGIASGLF